jgi:soluble epoxide hydrolase / lipid-phosphate phosphatase
MAFVWYPAAAKRALLPSGVTYSYVHIPAASTHKPTILFVHGFPSSSFDWRHQIAHFAALGYGVLAPDLLGYGSTSRPSSPSAYKGKVMANHLAELLSHEKIGKVHGVAHDFGSPLLGRLVAYFPESLLSCTFCSVPYMEPGSEFDFDVGV